jgi:hypothetical protein
MNVPRHSAPLPRLSGAALLLPVALVLYGLWTLPSGYFTGMSTSSYPTSVKVALGLGAIASGVGLLRRLAWAPWPAALVLATQLVSVRLPGYSHQAVVFAGLWFNLPTSEGTVHLGINVLALAMLIVLFVLMTPAPAAGLPPAVAAPPDAGRGD